MGEPEEPGPPSPSLQRVGTRFSPLHPSRSLAGGRRRELPRLGSRAEWLVRVGDRKPLLQSPSGPRAPHLTGRAGAPTPTGWQAACGAAVKCSLSLKVCLGRAALRALLSVPPGAAAGATAGETQQLPGACMLASVFSLLSPGPPFPHTSEQPNVSPAQTVVSLAGVPGLQTFFSQITIM